MRNIKRIRSMAIIGLAIVMFLSGAGFVVPSNEVIARENFTENQDISPAEAPTFVVMNVDLQLPQGSRIDYLRIYYKDNFSQDGYAWVTTYDGAGGYDDIAFVPTTNNSGYGTNLSSYVGIIVDNYLNAYVLNWRPMQLGRNMQLCGLRVAYRLPDGMGGWTNFYYVNVAGSALRPRNSTQPWTTDNSGGCMYVPGYSMNLPIIRK